ncbi:MAG TPA: hypothetical protein GXX67_12480 [Petrimonas sp.]|nr:hypothetical protein [Petrimonas sp.]
MWEYKFRGRRLDNKKWVHGSLIIDGTNGRYYIGELLFPKPGQAFSGRRHGKETTKYQAIGFYEVDPATVGQFIGEIDIKEQEIFEGDIDGCEPGELMYVAFEEASYGLKLFDDKTYFDNYIDWSMTDIIGNIHDNPELVEAIK